MSKNPKQKAGKKAGNQTGMIKYKQEKLQTKNNTRTWQTQQNAGESRHEDRTEETQETQTIKERGLNTQECFTNGAQVDKVNGQESRQRLEVDIWG